MTAYIFRASDPFAPPPYRAEGSTFHGFVVETEHSRARSNCSMPS